jgi:AcrR family transcriptional regulator
MPALAPPAPVVRAPRSDGAEARERLLLTALRLFAAKGFAKTSVREIAQAAGANVASIGYYFGDKAGIYRAAFVEPLGNLSDDIAVWSDPALPLPEALAAFFRLYMHSMKQGDIARQCVRLHVREVLEPTGYWQQELERDVQRTQQALEAVLCRGLGLAAPDDDIRRLAFSLTGLSMHLHIAHDLVDAAHAPLLATAEAIDTWTARLLDYALAMVGAERARRAADPAADSAAPADNPSAGRAAAPAAPIGATDAAAPPAAAPAPSPRNRRRTSV